MHQKDSSKSMELLLSHAILLLIPIFLLIKLLIGKRQQVSSRLAPGPTNLPIIGSLHHLLRRQPPHRTLRDLSAVYGPIMSLKLGEIPAVVVSSAEAAREIMKTHDVIFASRPTTASFKAISYEGKDLVLAPYCEYWRQIRRLSMAELFSPKRVLSFRTIREEEVHHTIQSIAASAGAAVDLTSLFQQLSNNITARAVVGGRTEDQKMFLSAIGELVKVSSGFNMIDLFPSMPEFINRIAGFRQPLECSCQNLDRIVDKIVLDHRQKASGKIHQLEEQDLTDVLLRVQHDGSLELPLSDDHIKSIVNDMLIAGSETTATIMEWTMSELIGNPEVMNKAQREVRDALGGNSREMKGEDDLVRARLTYLPLVIKEALRLHPPVPLLLPRENQEKCYVMGYEIPAKTTVFVNAWVIGRDPNYWDDPETFWPERFEDKSVDFKGADFQFIPFGAGRRICPGIQFGLALVQMALALLLYYFDWQYATKKGEKLDMTETLGMTLRRKSPLCLIPTPHILLPRKEQVESVVYDNGM